MKKVFNLSFYCSACEAWHYLQAEDIRDVADFLLRNEAKLTQVNISDATLDIIGYSNLLEDVITDIEVDIDIDKYFKT